MNLVITLFLLRLAETDYFWSVEAIDKLLKLGDVIKAIVNI
ncbi:MAG: hypothetical protein WBA93_23900 [Microcoleaceae cyanobacterium]